MDKKRILSKLDELNQYLSELKEIKTSSIDEYINSIEKKRACERLIQISIETVIDICNILVSGLKLGLPFDEEDIFIKLENKKLISKETSKMLREMKGFRNILVHNYGDVDDELVFKMISKKLGDFDKFRKEVLKNI